MLHTILLPNVFHIQSDSVAMVQFRLTIKDDNKNERSELFEIPVKDQGTYRRTSLNVSDRYVTPFGINHRMSDDWFENDYVGASEKYTLPLIASDCLESHIVEYIRWVGNHKDYDNINYSALVLYEW